MGLQKLTKSAKRAADLFEKDKITHEDLVELSQEERVAFFKLADEKLNNSKGYDKDRFMEQMDIIMGQQTKNEVWEMNHANIICEITKFIDEYGRMPLKIELVERTGLSRQTLHKHIKEYKVHKMFKDHMELYQFMSQKLMAKMFQFAIRGDVKAGRLYFDMIGKMGGQGIKNQTNYIQVNNLVISEEKLKALGPDQLRKIEDILCEVEIASMKTPEN